MSKRRPPAPIADAPPYERTDADLAAVAALDGRRKARGRQAKIKAAREGDVMEVQPLHPDLEVGWSVIANAMGTPSTSFADQLLRQLIVGAKQADGMIDEAAVNAGLALVQGIAPRDEVEAVLAAQMVAVNRAVTKAAGMFHAADMLPQWTAAELALNRLTRTFAQQVDTLKRYRATGEQKVTVQHVTVNEGGQAVVGEVHHNSTPAATPPALDYSPGVILDAVVTPERGRDGR